MRVLTSKENVSEQVRSRSPARSAARARPLRRLVEQALATSGAPLDGATRARMETRLGHHFAQLAVEPQPMDSTRLTIVPETARTELAAERIAAEILRADTTAPAPRSGPAQTRSSHPAFSLGNVRIHTDETAARSARALNALAYTVGHDIFFDTGMYAPNTRAGEGLLAHELTHAVQESRGIPTAPLIHRKQASKSLPPPDALQVALNGDDDSVRDLVNNPAWAKVKPDAKQSATLIIHLLVGYTGDDDEQAGLEILRRDIMEGILDPTLLELNQRGRFGQLLDDYDGSEYRELLVLLSDNMLDIRTMFFYLDQFIAMTWVREHEERAIVRLLKRVSKADQARLLESQFREEELRKAIDTDEVSVEYEVIVTNALGERAKRIYKDQQHWRKIFDERIEKCKPRGMSGARAEELWKAAVTDLEKELGAMLVDYADKVLNATILPYDNPDPDKLAEINRHFRAALGGVLERKQAEFCSELKWNVEFNRNLDEAFGTVWTADDLAKMDKILAKLPPEVLHANPNFKVFERETKRANRPWLGGETSSDASRISLLHEISFKTTVHELGHTVHDADPTLLDNFQKLSGWEFLGKSAIDALKKGDKKNDPDFDKLLARLEEKRKKDGSSTDECGEKYKDGFFYLYNRYGNGYWRYPTKRPNGAAFITDYAATHPMDDFAETFAYYFATPDKLKGSAYKKKFEFMRIEVFVKFWLERQRRAVSAQFARIQDEKMPRPMYGSNLRDDIIQKYIDPIDDELADAFTTQEEAKVKEVQADKSDKPIPLQGQGSAAVDKVAAPYLAQLRDICDLGQPIVRLYSDFQAELELVTFGMPQALQSAFNSLRDTFVIELKDKLWSEFEPLADRVRKGEHITMPKWQAVEQLRAQYMQSAHVIEPYLPYFAQLSDERTKFSYYAHAELTKFPAKSASWEKVRVFAAERLKKAYAMMDAVEVAIRQGKPFDPAVFKDPVKVIQGYRDELAKFIKTVK